MQEFNDRMQELLIRYLDKEADEAEIAEVEVWLRYPDNLEYFEGLKQLHSRVGDTQKATPAKVDVNAAWEKVAAKTIQKRGLEVEKPKTNWGVWLRVAAVLVIGFSIFWWITQTNETPTQVATLKTMKTTDSTLLVSLPDGSRVTLNSNSSLSYPENFDGGVRNVELEGEAFFDISRDTTKPFTISTGDAQIRVLGTSFLVKNHRDSGVAVLVKTGKVQLTKKASEQQGVKLVKGEQGFLAKAKEVPTKEAIEDLNYLYVYDKVLRFENTPIKLVLKDLEKYYKVQFKVQPNTIEGCKITAKFEESTLDEILETLKIYFSWEIQQNKNVIAILGKGCL